MALEKHIMSVYNVNATYWKIVDVTMNRIDGSATFHVNGYYDVNAGTVFAEPLKVLEYNLTAEVFGALVQSLDVGGDIVAGGYQYLKTLPEFFNAVDC